MIYGIKIFEIGILVLAFLTIIGAVVVFYFAVGFAKEANRATVKALKDFSETITKVSHPWYQPTKEVEVSKPRKDAIDRQDISDLDDDEFRKVVLNKE